MKLIISIIVLVILCVALGAILASVYYERFYHGNASGKITPVDYNPDTTYTGIRIQPTINQTGTSTLYVNHTDTDEEKRRGDNVERLQRLYPHNSTCSLCGLPWPECQPKILQITEKWGIFTLCTYCWDNSTIDERVFYYESLFNRQKIQWPEFNYYNIEDVKTAVLKESSK